LRQNNPKEVVLTVWVQMTLQNAIDISSSVLN